MSEMPTPGYGAAPPPGGLRPGELLDRFLARLIDGVLLAVVYAILGVFLFTGVFLTNTSGFVATTITSVFLTALQLGYFALMESNQGQTVGKMVMKLKVVGPDGQNPTMEQALRRNIWLALSLLGIVPIIGSLVGGLAQLAAVIMIAVGINNDTVNRQAWHDQFAGGTRVLKLTV